ncbi:MAG: hypothetical protein AAGI07_14470 [Bacteroidota bacterium]
METECNEVLIPLISLMLNILIDAERWHWFNTEVGGANSGDRSVVLRRPASSPISLCFFSL